MKDNTKKKRRLFTIRVKTTLMIVVFGLILAEIAMIYFTISSSRENRAQYKAAATDLSETVALSIDVEKVKNVKGQVASIYDSLETKLVRDDYEGTPEFEAYLAECAQVRNTEDYIYIQNYLKAIYDVNDDTEGIYVCYVDYERGLGIYLVYDVENEWYPVGMIDYIYEEDYPMLENPMLGFVASIYVDTATGDYLVTAGTPIVDPADPNNVIAYALVDITMNTVRKSQKDRIVRLFIYLISTVIILCIAGIIVINYLLIKPVRTLQNAAKTYDVNYPDKTHEVFSKLQVNVNDEFADLAESMKVMENDIHNKIVELTKTNEVLSETRQVASEMAELANKDGLTGVRNKIAYDNQCREIDKQIENKDDIQFGIAMIDLNYLKNINDDYGHDSGDSALIKLCNFICTIFAHSPVYRIGGDEFVVITRGSDYTNASKLVDEFNAKIDGLSKDDELLPAEKVSAAIGYATYNKKQDKSVDDVFKKADKAMYARKHEMKERDNK